MQVQLEFVFDTEPDAYPFLNTANHFAAKDLIVKRGKSSQHVLIRYRYADGEFDDTAAKLDDLARDMGGEEFSG
ncbi:MAG: hypothetical protein VYE47_03780 [Pseudomonadota bacterium]|nr:hypothetical protein [Pseudomonadota bacterium]